MRRKLLLRICLLATVWLLALPNGLHAQFTFTTNNGVITITEYTGSNSVVVIPNATNGYPVTSVGDNAFSFSSVNSVTIPDSVTNIGNNVFFPCANLTNVTVGSNLVSIGSSAFANCPGLTSFVIPNSVTSVGSYAFNYSGITSATIPNGVASIGTGLFAFCTGLTNVALPNSITSIGSQAFLNCSGLTSITIPNSVTNIGSQAFDQCFLLASVTIGKNVATVGDTAFQFCQRLTSLYFQGNPPNFASSLISDISPDTNATVYYLPGTTGWGSSFGGLPAILWNPQAQTGNGSFGVHSNQFGFNVTGTMNIPIVLEASTNLDGPWIPLQAVTLTNGLFYFSDPQWTNYPSRFYRISSP